MVLFEEEERRIILGCLFIGHELSETVKGIERLLNFGIVFDQIGCPLFVLAKQVDSFDSEIVLQDLKLFVFERSCAD